MTNTSNRKNGNAGQRKSESDNAPSGKTQQKNAQENLAKGEDNGDGGFRTASQIQADDQADKAARAGGNRD